MAHRPMYLAGHGSGHGAGEGAWTEVPIYDRATLQPGDAIDGPATILEKTGPNVIEPGCRAEINSRGHLIARRQVALARTAAAGTQVDPVMLEVFHTLFMSLAEDRINLAEGQNVSIRVNVGGR